MAEPAATGLSPVSTGPPGPGTIAAATMVALPAAHSETLAPSRVTAVTTDATPAAGQEIRLSGAVWSVGDRVPATVRVKAWRDGEWVQLPGAVVRTSFADRYHVRVVLQTKGERRLRVVGDPHADDIAKAHRVVTVTVH